MWNVEAAGTIAMLTAACQTVCQGLQDRGTWGECRSDPAALEAAMIASHSPDSPPQPVVTRRREQRIGMGARLFALGFAIFLALPPLALYSVRDSWLATLEDEAAQEDWEAFRRDMREQSDRDGPVQRKVPKSAEPPLRVWLRDHMVLAVAAWLVLGGTLGAFVGFLALGAFHSPSTSRAVAATTTNSTSAMPNTPNRENTAQNPRSA